VTTPWGEYFDRVTPESPLYRVQAAVYVESLAAAVGLHDQQQVLDFGCGFGLVAALVAPRVARVCWWEPSRHMRGEAERHLASLPNATFWDLSAMPDAPYGHPLPALRFDLILVNSVVQYMPPDDVWAWLPWWRRMLKAGGRLVLSDLITGDHRGVADMIDLLRLGARHGSPVRAAAGAIGGVVTYWRTRHAAPLTRVDRDDLTSRAREAGLDTEFLTSNLTHFRTRATAILRPRVAR
jgi:cyclopropane fatty-acyl-phospholipid synthase-like methyltransferase